MSKTLATILNVEQSESESTENSIEVDSEQDMNQKANDLDKLVELMKKNLSNKRRKIQILTLTPKPWSLRKTAKEFKVSKTTARKARILREEKDI